MKLENWLALTLALSPIWTQINRPGAKIVLVVVLENGKATGARTACDGSARRQRAPKNAERATSRRAAAPKPADGFEELQNLRAIGAAATGDRSRSA